MVHYIYILSQGCFESDTSRHSIACAYQLPIPQQIDRWFKINEVAIRHKITMTNKLHISAYFYSCRFLVVCLAFLTFDLRDFTYQWIQTYACHEIPPLFLLFTCQIFKQSNSGDFAARDILFTLAALSSEGGYIVVVVIALIFNFSISYGTIYTNLRDSREVSEENAWI